MSCLAVIGLFFTLFYTCRPITQVEIQLHMVNYPAVGVLWTVSLCFMIGKAVNSILAFLLMRYLKYGRMIWSTHHKTSSNNEKRENECQCNDMESF